MGTGIVGRMAFEWPSLTWPMAALRAIPKLLASGPTLHFLLPLTS